MINIGLRYLLHDIKLKKTPCDYMNCPTCFVTISMNFVSCGQSTKFLNDGMAERETCHKSQSYSLMEQSQYLY